MLFEIHGEIKIIKGHVEFPGVSGGHYEQDVH
jgi:hypothetical protein